MFNKSEYSYKTFPYINSIQESLNFLDKISKDISSYEILFFYLKNFNKISKVVKQCDKILNEGKDNFMDMRMSCYFFIFYCLGTITIEAFIETIENTYDDYLLSGKSIENLRIYLKNKLLQLQNLISKENLLLNQKLSLNYTLELNYEKINTVIDKLNYYIDLLEGDGISKNDTLKKAQQEQKKECLENITPKEKEYIDILKKFFIDDLNTEKEYSIRKRDTKNVIRTLYKYDPGLSADDAFLFISKYIDTHHEGSNLRNYCREIRKDIPTLNQKV